MSPRKLEVQILGDASGAKKAFEATASAASGMASSVTSSIGGAARFVGTAFVGVGAGAAAVFGKGFMDAMDRQELGGKVGEDILAASANVYRNAWGESLEEVAVLMADTERAFGEGANLEGLTESALIIADKFGGDATEAMQTAAKMAADFGITGEEAFDMIASASDGMAGSVRDEFGAAATEYGGVFADLGLQARHMSTLFAGADSAIEVDKIGDAFKELSIRATDGSKATEEAFGAMGRDMGLYQELMFEGGDAAAEATFGIIRGLGEIEDPAEQAAAAIALFGSPLEDLGATAVPEFLENLQGMGTGFKDVEGAAGEMGEELGGNLSAQFESFKRQGLDRLAETIQKDVLPVVEQAVAWFRENWPQIKDTLLATMEAMRPAFDQMREWFEQVVGWVRENWPQISAILETVGAYIRDTIAPAYVAFVEKVWDVIGGIVGWVVDHWPQISATIEAVVSYVTDTIMPALVDAFEWVRGRIEAFIEQVRAFWTKFGEDIMAVLGPIWENLKEQFQGAVDSLTGIFNTFKALFEGDWAEMWEGIKEIFGGMWRSLKGVFNNAWILFKIALSLAFDGLKKIASMALDAVVQYFKDLPGNLLSAMVSAADMLKSVGGKLMGLIGEGITAAVVAVGEAIWDSLPGPVKWALEHGASGVSAVAGGVANFLGIGGEPLADEFETYSAYSTASTAESAKYGQLTGGGATIVQNFFTTDVSGQGAANTANEAKLSGAGGTG